MFERDIARGLFAGLVATVTVLAISIAMTAVGRMPQSEPIDVLSTFAHHFWGLPLRGSTGWAMLLISGATALGALFAASVHQVPGKTLVTRGLVFGVLVWFFVMLVIMPTAGFGFFGIHIGFWSPAFMLGVHCIYGLVLGITYDPTPSNELTAGQDF